MDEPSKIDLASLKIIRYPDPRLREVCAGIEEVDDRLRALVERMFEVMYAAGGVGLAAPQVGRTVRVFIANPAGAPGDEAEGVYINPEIIDEDGAVAGDEGCLSVPGLTCNIKRRKAVTVRATNLDGEVFTRSGEGLLARIFQHEMDHLNGVLVADRMSTVAGIANRRLLKDLADEYNKR